MANPFYVPGTYTEQEAKLLILSHRRKAWPFLQLFWSKFFWWECSREDCREKKMCRGHCGKKSFKMKSLRALSSILVTTVPGRSYRRKKRKEFESEFDFPEVGTPCFVCGEPYHHRHHIIPICRGGQNSTRNLVPLCRSCHQAVHKGQILTGREDWEKASLERWHRSANSGGATCNNPNVMVETIEESRNV